MCVCLEYRLVCVFAHACGLREGTVCVCVCAVKEGERTRESIRRVRQTVTGMEGEMEGSGSSLREARQITWKRKSQVPKKTHSDKNTLKQHKTIHAKNTNKCAFQVKPVDLLTGPTFDADVMHRDTWCLTGSSCCHSPVLLFLMLSQKLIVVEKN